MRTLLLVGLGCAVLLAGVFAYSLRTTRPSRTTAADANAGVALPSGDGAAAELAADHATAAAPLDLDSADIAMAGARTEVDPPDALSATVPAGRIHVQARFVEERPSGAASTAPEIAVEDQVVTCDLHRNGHDNPLVSITGTTQAGLVFLDFADPGMRPLELRLALSNRALRNKLLARRTLERPNQRSVANWKIIARARTVQSFAAQDLIGASVGDVELRVGFARFAASGVLGEVVEETVWADRGGRGLLPACRHERWRFATDHPDWIVLGQRRDERSSELRVVLARRATVAVSGVPEPRRPLSASARASKVAPFSPELRFELDRMEPGRLGLTAADPDVYGGTDEPSRTWQFSADGVPAGVRVGARLWTSLSRRNAREVALEAAGARRFRGLIGDDDGDFVLFEPGASELELSPAPKKEASPDTRYLGYGGASSAQGREPPIRVEKPQPIPFVVLLRFADGIKGRAWVALRPSASNPFGSSNAVTGTRLDDADRGHSFGLPFGGRWDIRIEVTRPHRHEQYVYGHDVSDGRLEVPIELVPAARVEFSHADPGARGAIQSLRWRVAPDASASVRGDRDTTSWTPEPHWLDAPAAAPPRDPFVVSKWQQSWSRDLRKGVVSIELPAGVPLEFQFRGEDATGRVYQPLQLGPIVLSSGASRIEIPDSLTGDLELVVAAHAAATDSLRARFRDANGRPMLVLPRSNDQPITSAALGALGPVLVRRMPPGEVTVVIEKRDGSTSEHKVCVERGATARLELGER